MTEIVWNWVIEHYIIYAAILCVVVFLLYKLFNGSWGEAKNNFPLEDVRKINEAYEEEYGDIAGEDEASEKNEADEEEVDPYKADDHWDKNNTSR